MSFSTPIKSYFLTFMYYVLLRQSCTLFYVSGQGQIPWPSAGILSDPVNETVLDRGPMVRTIGGAH